MSTLDISRDEWRVELDKCRPTKAGALTPDQIEFLNYARKDDAPVSWVGIRKIWIEKMGWPEISVKTIQQKYLKYLKLPDQGEDNGTANTKLD